MLHQGAAGTFLLVGLCLEAVGWGVSPQLGTAPVVCWAVGFCVGPLGRGAAEQDMCCGEWWFPVLRSYLTRRGHDTGCFPALPLQPALWIGGELTRDERFVL